MVYQSKGRICKCYTAKAPHLQPGLTRHRLDDKMEALQMGSEVRKRTEIVMVRVTVEEKAQLQAAARSAALTVPEYLRQLGARNEVKSKVDQRSLLNLLKVSADLGRLGGLLKLWLSESGQYPQRNKVSHIDIFDLLNKIAAGQNEVRELARRL